ncbi:hypothetical protein HMPREF1316_1564 [Olsenella profusa F0195]|uniref:Uncharacterized protein n=1 Tax=Olsenella profusa F0195 TaxID=1125712 RepID=U2TU03_9ACTN|nr:hypothetical protein HMPREF1316_1564 [Olsenella profusa F0195]
MTEKGRKRIGTMMDMLGHWSIMSGHVSTCGSRAPLGYLMAHIDY